MANLRELRKHAGELGIEYTKETKKEELMGKNCSGGRRKGRSRVVRLCGRNKTFG